jgi:integrase
LPDPIDPSPAEFYLWEYMRQGAVAMTRIHEKPATKQQTPAQRYLARLSPEGQRTMSQSLAHVGGVLTGRKRLDRPAGYQWEALSPQRLEWLRVELAKRYAPATVNKMLAALRGTFKAAAEMGQLRHSWDQLYRLTGHMGPPPSAGESTGDDSSGQATRYLSWGDLRALLEACLSDGRVAGQRDAALIALIAATGMQRSAVVKLQRRDYHASTGIVKGRDTKGRSVRFQVSTGLQHRLEDWLVHRGDAVGPLLLPINKAGRLYWRAMTAQSAYEMMLRRAQKAGLGRITSRSLHYGPEGAPLVLLHEGSDQALNDQATPLWLARDLPEARTSRAIDGPWSGDA